MEDILATVFHAIYEVFHFIIRMIIKFFQQIIGEILLQVPGYWIGKRLFRMKIELESFRSLLLSIVFWALVFIGLYGAYTEFGFTNENMAL